MITLVLSAITGCAQKKEPTPPAVAARFYALLETLAQKPPEAAVDSLEIFLRDYDKYEITDLVETEIDRYRAIAQGRYHEARELARQGEFDRAERILVDLAEHLGDTPDGDNARRHLEFEFYFGKAKWLLVRQRFEEAEVVARDLLDRDLTAFQAEQVEMILDNVGMVDAASGMAERAAAQAACRQLTVMLTQQFVEEGRYPSRLSLADVEKWGAHNSKGIIHGLSAIEDFKASAHNFSFVAVSKKGRHHIRVVDGQILD
jgi:hypothetical protein